MTDKTKKKKKRKKKREQEKMKQQFRAAITRQKLNEKLPNVRRAKNKSTYCDNGYFYAIPRLDMIDRNGLMNLFHKFHVRVYAMMVNAKYETGARCGVT